MQTQDEGLITFDAFNEFHENPAQARLTRHF
jgi:hypothetical protein